MCQVALVGSIKFYKNLLVRKLKANDLKSR